MRTIALAAAAVAAIGIAAPSQAAPAGEEMILSNHRVVLGTDLPHCTTEPEPTSQGCVWNTDPGRVDGNGRGVAIWVHADGKMTFVWPMDFAPGPRWGWVHPRMREWVEVNYDHRLSVSCMSRIEGDDWSTVKCANGNRFTVNW